MESLLLACFWLSFGVLTNEITWLLAGIGISFLLVLIVLIKSHGIKLSRFLLFWFGFNLVLFASTALSKSDFDGYRLPLLSLSGSLWMFLGENLKQKQYYFKIVKQSIIFASLGFVLLWLLALIFHWGIDVFQPDSLVTYASYYKTHNHLGDLLILPLIISILIPNPLGAVLFVLIMMATSRSSLIGLLVGMGYALYNQGLKTNLKKIFPVLLLFIIVFVIMSYGKSTIRSRDYYIEALAGLTRKPFGVGYGNFDIISSSPRFHVLGATGFSTYTHSVIFEWLSGVGWLGILGIGWLLVLAYRIGRKTSNNTLILFKSLWWAMLVPILLDSVYVVPTYWWLWMLITGMVL